MRINGLSTGQTAEMQSISDIFGKLAAGDIIKAKILEITGGELLLKMFDGTEFKASTAMDIKVKPGDILELMVSGKNEGRLYMETVKRVENLETPTRQELSLQLEKLDFVPDETNIRIATSLKASGFTFSKEVIRSAVSLMQQFSQLSSENAAFLASNSIKPSGDNLSMLINLLNGKLKLGNSLELLHNQLSEMIGELGPAPEANPGILNNSHADTAGKKSDQTLINNSANINSSNATQTNSDRASIIKANSGHLNNAYLNNEYINDNYINEDQLNRINEGTNKTVVNPDSDEFNKNSDFKLPNRLLLYNKNIVKERFNDDFKNSLKAAVKILEEAEGLFVKIESESFKSNIEIKKLSGSIYKKLDSLRDLIQSSELPGREDFLSRLAVAEDNVKLLNQVGANILYAQIPLSLSGFKTTAELFVMKQGAKKKKIDPENAVLFISLDTHNIGTVQSIIEIKGKNVGINFRAEIPEIIDFLKENMTMLYKSLSNTGYKLVDTRYRLISEPAGLADVEKVINDELNNRSKGVDLKI